MEKTPAIIVTEGLRKIYGRGAAARTALDGVSLEVGQGEFLSLIGTSGSGKTTLLNLIGGLDRPDRGRVEVDGRDLAELDDRALSRFRNRTIGFVFQHFHLLSHLTCLENVLLPAYFRGRAAEQEARDLLERVGIADLADQRPPALSGGQRQRLAIARALVNRPRIILCDEPTGNLDRRTGQQILELFGALHREQGITFVVITHEEVVSRAASRVLRLEDGKLAGEA